MPHRHELTQMLRELHLISGFYVSLHDTEWKQVAGYPEEHTAFCKKLQENPKALQLCKSSDMRAFEHVKQHKELYIYHCHCGLLEAIAPLYDFGVLSGYLMMGQMLDCYTDSTSQVTRLAGGYFDDKEHLQTLLAQIPRTTKEKITASAHIMSICADYITLTHRMNLGSRNLADEIKRYIGKHYADKLSIEFLSMHFLCSKSTLMNSFRDRFGITINRYINQVRIQQAQYLLSHTEQSIHVISDDCGFSDQNYFAKVFSKETGMTPRDFRHDSQKEE